MRRISAAAVVLLTVFLVQPLQGQVVAKPPAPGTGWMGFSWRPFPGGFPKMERDAQGRFLLPSVEERPFPLISGVTVCSPAHEAGLRIGDLLTRINGLDARETPPPFRESKPGAVQELEILRDGKTLHITLVEVEAPAEPLDCENPSRRP